MCIRDRNTKAVFISHIQGFNSLNAELLRTLKKKKIHLIEDVCESHGAKFKGKKLGSYGLMSNFSFYYAHHLSTIEGGMICTNNKKIYEMTKMFRSCLLYTSPSPRDGLLSRMPSSA